MEYRALQPREIAALERQGCVAPDWADVMVAEGFDTAYVQDCAFSGRVRLGALREEFALPGGVKVHAGLRRARLHNVEVGDDCLIDDVHNYIANYRLGRGCYIQNIGMLTVPQRSRFGQAVAVSVLNETGGREVLITDKLSAHLAYLCALYRHRPALIERLNARAEYYADKHASETGDVGDHATIVNTTTINAVRIGPWARVCGAGRLSNGTVASNAQAPVHIGQGVVADDFIVCSGADLDDGATIERCFVGQACRLGHNYSASDSLFFANCQGENGEACAIFAGPYTVTHHKSTLLIAGMFSFMNAGSGSNQSNHMYKLGPIHQGTLERGAKTSSDSYILWPSRVGAFSLVMGRHVNHSDTSNLPFSYLIEQKNTTYLVPGVNLRSVGTIRDAQKWPKRDRRTDPNRLDLINFNLLSPYTVQKMMKGVQTLDNLRYAGGELCDVYSFHSAKIRNSALTKGLMYYDIAIRKFLGNSIIKRLEGAVVDSDEALRRLLRPDTEQGTGEWVDLAGLIAPKTEVQALIGRIERGEAESLAEINAAFQHMHHEYYHWEWSWVYEHMFDFYGLTPSEITRADVRRIVESWREAVTSLDRMVYDDAKKEFSLAAMTGFGADGKREQKEKDFEEVRGYFDSNPFVTAVLRHIEEKSALAEETLSRIKN